VSIYETEKAEIKQRKENRDEKRAFWWAYKRHRARIRINLGKWGVASTLKPMRIDKNLLNAMLNHNRIRIIPTEYLFFKDGDLQCQDFLDDSIKKNPRDSTGSRKTEEGKTVWQFEIISQFDFLVRPDGLEGQIYTTTHKELRYMYSEILRDERREHQKQSAIKRMVETYRITPTEAERCFLGKVDLEEAKVFHRNQKGEFMKSAWWRDHTVKDRQKMGIDKEFAYCRMADKLDIYPQELYRIIHVCGEDAKIHEIIKNESWWKLDREEDEFKLVIHDDLTSLTNGLGIYVQTHGRAKREDLTREEFLKRFEPPHWKADVSTPLLPGLGFGFSPTISSLVKQRLNDGKWEPIR
jgi:hypothetical protein